MPRNERVPRHYLRRTNYTHSPPTPKENAGVGAVNVHASVQVRSLEPTQKLSTTLPKLIKGELGHWDVRFNQLMIPQRSFSFPNY